MNAWLMYCHLNKNVNPNPGPCRNECLLDTNPDEAGWVAKPGLVMARKDKEGDYRRISKATWETFCELYPGSGPTIRMKFYQDEAHLADGLYDTSGWIIDQTQFATNHAPPPRKLNIGFSFRNNNSNQNGAEETKGSEDPLETSTSGQMDDPKSLNDESSKTSFKQFFGTTANPMYQPTSRSSESAKDKEPLMSEVSIVISPISSLSDLSRRKEHCLMIKMKRFQRIIRVLMSWFYAPSLFLSPSDVHLLLLMTHCLYAFP